MTAALALLLLSQERPDPGLSASSAMLRVFSSPAPIARRRSSLDESQVVRLGIVLERLGRQEARSLRGGAPFSLSQETRELLCYKCGEFGVDFDRRSGSVVSLHFGEPTRDRVEKSDLDPLLTSSAREIVARFSPLAELVSSRIDRAAGQSVLRQTFRGRHAGLATDETWYVAYDRNDGRLLDISFPVPIDTETHGDDPILGEDALRTMALAYLGLSRSFPQGEIEVSEVSIGLAQAALPVEGESSAVLRARFSPARIAQAASRFERRIAIPCYRLVVRDSQSADRFVCHLDARDGSVLSAALNHAIEGRRSALPRWPRRVNAGVEGTVTAIGRTSPTPAGCVANVVDGKTVLLGFFEPGPGTLWLRRTKDEPYRAFRSDAKLRKALAAQVRRTEATGKKG